MQNWLLVYVGNLIGCLGTVALVLWDHVDALGAGAVGDTAIEIARSKAALSFGEGFARGILCNAFVCLAVWLAMGGRSVTDKILAILFPITAFVAIGLEHSIANWFFLPYGLALVGDRRDRADRRIVRNLAATTAGNIVGGTLLVAIVYWFAYLRAEPRPRGPAA